MVSAVSRVWRHYRKTIRALETRGQDISWSFAQVEAMEAAREAERVLRERLDPYLDQTDWSDQDFADLMRLELQYQDIRRHSRQLMNSLLLRPAPTVAALQWKLEYLGKRRLGYGKPVPAEAQARIAEDASRLLGRMAEAFLRAQPALTGVNLMHALARSRDAPGATGGGGDGGPGAR